MICLALGLGVLGFAAMRHARRCRYHCHGYDHHHWDHWNHRGGRRGLYMLLSRIDASPAQERAIIGEVDRLKSRLRDLRGGVKDTRADLAAALRGPTLDDAALGAVLDERQRETLADLVDRGPWAWRRSGGGGPYRM